MNEQMCLIKFSPFMLFLNYIKQTKQQIDLLQLSTSNKSLNIFSNHFSQCNHEQYDQSYHTYDKQAHSGSHELNDQIDHSYDSQVHQYSHELHGQVDHSYDRQYHWYSHELNDQAYYTCSYILINDNKIIPEKRLMRLKRSTLAPIPLLSNPNHTSCIYTQKPCDQAYGKCSIIALHPPFYQGSHEQDAQWNGKYSKT